MRRFALPLFALALSGQAPPPEVATFDQALTDSHRGEAAKILDKLIVQRTPADGHPRADPLLNALLGRFHLAANLMAPAGIYLDHAPVGELPPAMRAGVALDHGRALEVRGDRKAALGAYREAAAAAVSDTDRRRAALGVARQLLAENPVAVRNELAPVTGGPAPQDWEAKFLVAASASLLGDATMSRQLASEAWSEASTAPVNELAPLHVAVLQAGLAAARHDVAAERAMLTSANGLAVSAAAGLSAQLPVCGDGGVRPADYVILGYVVGPYGTHQLWPIAASRPEAVAPFIDSLAGFQLIKEEDGTKPIGTVITVACRSSVSMQFTERPLLDPLLDWFASHGIYPASSLGEDDDEHLNAVSDRIDALASRFGKDSPLLIAARWQTMSMLEMRAAEGDSVLPGQLSDLATEIAGGLRLAGAPDWLAQGVELRATFRQAIASSKPGADRMTSMEGLFRNALSPLPFRYQRAFLSEGLSAFRDDWPAPFAQAVLDVDASPHPDPAGRERQAWLLTVAAAHHALGQQAQARVARISAQLPADLCPMMDEEPDLLEQHFSYSDYPDDLIAGEQEGAVLFDFDILPNGAVGAHRVIYSLPSGLFDAASSKGLSAVRYTAPSKGGKIVGCHGMFQPIVWRIEKKSDMPGPAVIPTLSGPIS